MIPESYRPKLFQQPRSATIVALVRGVLPGNVSSVSGTVSIVQLSFIIGDNGSTVQVTSVTFLQEGTSSTLGFCGDQRDRFPMEQTVRPDFNPGHTCDSIVTIVIT